MCCSLRPAKLTNTILYAAEATHDGRLVHVMGYQNRAANQSEGANAMLLPIPSDVSMSPDNMLDTTAAKWVLKDYAGAIRAAHTRLSRGTKSALLGSYGDRRVQVFDKGSYSVALAENARDLVAALDYLPVGRRPLANGEIFDAYDRFYPNWKMALCSWSGIIEAEPLLWWYEPKDPSQLFMPALDAHDGHAPRVESTVGVDHTIVVGSATAPKGYAVHFRDTIPDTLKPFLATKVAGLEFESGTSLKNGDFRCKVANVHKGIIDRVPPPGQA